MIRKIFLFTSSHKFLSAIFVFIFSGFIYYGYGYFYGSTESTRYVSAKASKGTLIVSISGSGQVSAANQVDIKAKTSGEIIALYAKIGQEVDAGTLLATIDVSDAERAVRDAATSLETAKLELDKMLEPLDELILLQAENSLTQAKESKQKAEDNLKKAYDDGFNTTANAFLELPSIMAGLQGVLFDASLASSQQNYNYYADSVKIYDEKANKYRDDAYNSYQSARKAYDASFSDYKTASRFSDDAVTEDLISKTYETAKSVAEAVKNANDLIQFYQDKLTEKSLKPNSISNTHIASLNAYTGQINSVISGLLSIKRTIQDSKDAIIGAERSIEEKALSLAKIKNGPEDLDIRAKKITIQQKEDALATAKETLADHYVRAPFTGVIAKVGVKKGDSASASAIIFTLITKQRVAEISLNEVDVSKVKIGQKVTIVFDAIENLSITGEVAEIESVGTIVQGVVTYGVKISFDTQDERVKPGMSVSAAIITDIKQDTLMVPNSAVKQQNGAAYVEIFSDAQESLAQAPRQQNVQLGLSNDTMTEIVSGLNESDKVVTQTITLNTSQNQTQQISGLRIPGITGGGGGGGIRR